MEIEQTLERRKKPRVRAHFPLTIREINNSRVKLEEQGTLENISASGLYFWTQKQLQLGDEVSLTIHMSDLTAEEGQRTNRLSTIGKVVRVELTPNNEYGVAVAINTYRFH